MSQPSTANGGFPSVVVTAVTATTSISPDIESTWKGLLAGESGIHALEDEFVTKWDLAVKIGGHLKDPVDSHMGRLDMRRMSYVQRMGKLLGGQLWESAGSPEVDPDRFAVVVGTGLGGAERIVESYDLMNAGGPRKVSPLAVQMIMPNGAAAVIGLQLGARAGVMTPVSACSSGSEAIAHAWRQIVMGDADVAVCGGVEGPIEALPIAAFSMMRAMSTRNDEPERASRPFDKDRDGFVFGEAGALMLIETEEHAKARGAKPLARLLGAGITSDAFHMVAPAAVTAVTMTSHQPRTATPPSAAALSPTSSSTTPPQPPIVTRSRLPGLLPPLDDVKNFVGIQNLVAHEPMLQPQTPNGSINPAECWPAVGGGVPSAYDLGTVIGFYGLTIDEPPTGTAPNQVGQLIVAFRDAATAQRHLADLASIWRRCGGRTVTLFRSEWRRPVELSTSVPEVVDGITTMVLTAQGPVLRVREDHAIAAKNNVLVDVDIMTPDTSRGQQAVIGITNYILAKIPG